MIALAKTIETLLENKKYSSLRDVLSSMNEADIAAMFSEVSSDSLPLLFRLLPKDLAADTFALMDTDEQELLIRGFPRARRLLPPYREADAQDTLSSQRRIRRRYGGPCRGNACKCGETYS